MDLSLTLKTAMCQESLPPILQKTSQHPALVGNAQRRLFVLAELMVESVRISVVVKGIVEIH